LLYHLLSPGSPWGNGYIESFHGRFRDELLNRELFYSVKEAKVLAENRRLDYNHHRLHSSLNYMTPAAFAEVFYQIIKGDVMNTKLFSGVILLATILLIYPVQIRAEDVNSTPAQELKTIQLPKPQTDGGKPLMQVLNERKSSRQFSSEKLPVQVLSNMLWAAWGINREDGKRTAPSAMNMQEIDVYVAMEEGLYLYDAKTHALVGVLAKDIRQATGKQDFVKDAPINLVYAADFSKMGKTSADQKDFYAAADAGYISQNVYLYCASEGLATVVRGMVDKPVLAAAMKLRSDQKVIFAQTVGYPKK
jgi:SagB-type dehydrogenase family enzyme